MPLPVMAAVALATVAAKGVSAYSQNQASKREAGRLAANRPFLPQSTAARDQQAFAESELSRGESRAANDYYNETNRNFANSLNTTLKMGGDVNDVGALFDGSDVGLQRARMMSENLRLNNIQNVVRAWNNSDNSEQQRFQFNQWAPFADAAQANARARQQSADNMWSAVDDAVGIGLRYADSNKTDDEDTGGFSGSPLTSTNPSTARYAPPSVASKYGAFNPNALNTRR